MELMGIGGAFSLLVIIKPILEVLLYLSLIFLSFKAIRALNVYINKNS
jgi:hypothetical protein